MIRIQAGRCTYKDSFCFQTHINKILKLINIRVGTDIHKHRIPFALKSLLLKSEVFVHALNQHCIAFPSQAHSLFLYQYITIPEFCQEASKASFRYSHTKELSVPCIFSEIVIYYLPL